jgi:hypothetical protein
MQKHETLIHMEVNNNATNLVQIGVREHQCIILNLELIKPI